MKKMREIIRNTAVSIASKNGMPPNLMYDFFIDNAAPSGASIYRRINVFVNITIGWMWCCEYVSDMTRKGKIPGILISV